MTEKPKVAAPFEVGEKNPRTNEEQVRRGNVVERLAPDSHAFLPGTWFMGGHHNGEEAVRKMWETASIIWPGHGTTL